MDQPGVSVDVNWYGPYKLESIPRYSVGSHPGLYFIKKHRLLMSNRRLYIGKAERQPVASRVQQHTWVRDEPGKLRVYIGILEFPIDNPEFPKLLDDVESLLIHALRPKRNKLNMQSYRGRRSLAVHNCGKWGFLWPDIDADRDLKWDAD